jgi:hypothetical protein
MIPINGCQDGITPVRRSQVSCGACCAITILSKVLMVLATPFVGYVMVHLD